MRDGRVNPLLMSLVGVSTCLEEVSADFKDIESPTSCPAGPPDCPHSGARPGTRTPVGRHARLRWAFARVYKLLRLWVNASCRLIFEKKKNEIDAQGGMQGSGFDGVGTSTGEWLR